MSREKKKTILGVSVVSSKRTDILFRYVEIRPHLLARHEVVVLKYGYPTTVRDVVNKSRIMPFPPGKWIHKISAIQIMYKPDTDQVQTVQIMCKSRIHFYLPPNIYLMKGDAIALMP